MLEKQFRPPESSGMEQWSLQNEGAKGISLTMTEMDNNCLKKKKKRPNLLNTELV